MDDRYIYLIGVLGAVNAATIGYIVYMVSHFSRDIKAHQVKIINQEREINELEKENEILEFKLGSRK